MDVAAEGDAPVTFLQNQKLRITNFALRTPHFALPCHDSLLMEDDLSAQQFIYITTTGRVTGLPREIEIWFVERRGRFYIFAEHFFKANWVRNIQKNPRVQVRLGKREFAARARVLDESRDAALWKEVQQSACEKYGWGEGLPVEITPVEE